MLLTIDSEKQSLDDVLRVLAALYDTPITRASHQVSAASISVARSRTKKASAGKKNGPPPTAAEVRAWARSEGISVNSRGTLPQALVSDYLARK